MKRWKPLRLLAPAALLAAGLAARANADPPGAPWIVRDLGATQAPSVVDVDARGIWFLRVDNGDIGTSQPLDNFLFVHQPLAGDGSILALLLGQEGGAFGRLGVTFRESLSLTARNVALTMVPFGVAVSHRSGPGRATLLDPNQVNDTRYGVRQFPLWLRLQREGDRFTPFASSDGVGWSQLRPPIPISGFARDAFAGIAASTGFGAGGVRAVLDNPTLLPGQVSPLVQACAGNGSVLLNWAPVAGATGYVVRRSTPETPGFAADLVTPAPIRETSFSQTGLPNGRHLRYLVAPVSERGGRQIEGMATAVIATPVATPANLSGCDVNLEATMQRGSLIYDAATGVYTLSGSGGGIGDIEDHAFLASQLVKGDFQITVRIMDRPTRTHPLARAGLMVRESLEGPSRMAALLGTVERGLAFQSRAKTGETATGTTAIADQEFKTPLYLRLVRRGNAVAPFVSTDGATFTPAGDPKTFDPPLPESVYAGYAITAHNAGAIATNRFRDLTIAPAP